MSRLYCILFNLSGLTAYALLLSLAELLIALLLIVVTVSL